MSLAARLHDDRDWSPLSAFALGLFILFYAPCLPTVVAIGKEAGWRWAGFSMLYTTALAYVLAVAVFQGARLLGFG